MQHITQILSVKPNVYLKNIYKEIIQLKIKLIIKEIKVIRDFSNTQRILHNFESSSLNCYLIFNFCFA